MGKRDKVIQKIFNGSNVTPDEVMAVLGALGFKAAAVGGSHLTFRKEGRQSITLVVTQNPIKRYMLDKIQAILRSEGYND